MRGRLICVLAVLAVASAAGCGGNEGVPYVVGMTQREAEEALEKAGLQWQFLPGGPVRDSIPDTRVGGDDAYIVVHQDPRAEEGANDATVVSLRVCSAVARAGCNPGTIKSPRGPRQ